MFDKIVAWTLLLFTGLLAWLGFWYIMGYPYPIKRRRDETRDAHTESEISKD